MGKTRTISLLRGLGALFIAIAMLTLLFPSPVAQARPPEQAGDEPGFVSATYVAPDGSATIQSQETRLAPDYMVANGTLEGLELTASGLTLAAGQNVGVYTSNTIQSPLGSTSDIAPTWAADLPAGSQLQVETRLFQAGSPSDWATNPEAFYPVRDNEHGGSLIWVGGGQVGLQYRITLQRAADGTAPILRSLTLTFNDTDQGPDSATIASQMDSVAASMDVCPAPKPPVVPRTAWGCPDGETSPRRPPIYAPVTHVVIHHTATPNAPYQDWAQVVRSVWNYHANILWWGDVGYNYLIDPNGVIYEGRAGGDDVVGIHDTVNDGSMGLGFIGCYGNCNYLGLSNAQPSTAMLNSGVALMAWKLGQKGVDPYGVTPYDGAGMLPAIAGGRDVAATFSPGDYLYDKLPWLRDATAQRIDCGGGNACRFSNVEFDKDQYAPGEPIYLTVKLEDALGNPLPGANVQAIVTRAAEASGSNAFNLVDLTGYYQGSYADTQLPGTYIFDINASDPSGQRFAPCTASVSTSVGGSPIPGGALIKAEPEHLVTSWCSFQASTAVSVYNVSDLRSIYLEIDYDPNIIQVVDADTYQWGVQVRLDGGFVGRPTTVLQNEVDTARGHIVFEASMLSSQNIQGDAGLIIIDWRPQLPGISPVTITRAEFRTASGQVIVPAMESATVEIVPDCLMGTIYLQGRADASGVTVTSASGAQVQTDAEGNFSLAGQGPITVQHPGYLGAVADTAMAGQSGTEGNSLGSITLLAGDLNQDNVINIFDLALIASQLDTQNTISDLNADGTVNIMDVALIASNFGQQGPQEDWQ